MKPEQVIFLLFFLHKLLLSNFEFIQKHKLCFLAWKNTICLFHIPRQDIWVVSKLRILLLFKNVPHPN